MRAHQTHTVSPAFKLVLFALESCAHTDTLIQIWNGRLHAYSIWFYCIKICFQRKCTHRIFCTQKERRRMTLARLFSLKWEKKYNIKSKLWTLFNHRYFLTNLFSISMPSWFDFKIEQFIEFTSKLVLYEIVWMNFFSDDSRWLDDVFVAYFDTFMN